MGIFRKERIEESKVQATFIVDQLQTKIRVAMEGLENKYQNFQQKIDQLSLAIVESFSFPVVGMQLAPALARVNNGLDQLTPREMEQVALFFGDSSFNRVTKGGRSIQGGKDRRISREFSRRVWTVIFAIIFLFILVSCTNTVGTEQPVEPTPITEVVEIEPTQVAPELPEGPAFAPTAEAESPVNEENPVTEEAPVAEESPEAVGTPIPDSVVIDWIAQYAPSTPTPETFAEVPVISFDNNTSFVMTGGKAYVVTRVPDSDPIVEEFAADSYEQTEDGSVNFFQGEGEARMKVAVLAKTTNGNVELTPTAVPAPTPTTETPTETPTEEAPVEDETETPPVLEEEGPFTVEELGSTQFPLTENDIGVESFRIKVDNIVTDEIDLGNGFSAPLSVTGWYVDAKGNQQQIQTPIIIKGPNGEALIDGIFYENYNWDEMDIQSLINVFRINYWLNHKDEYDDPSTWINGGNGNGVNFGSGDILSIPFASGYNSPIFQNPGYGTVANFGEDTRRSLYTEESYQKFLSSGDPGDLELTELAQQLGIPENFLWGINIYNYMFEVDL